MRQRLARVLGGVAILALVAGGAAACKKEEATTPGGSTVSGLKIGFFGALTGDNAGLVTPGKNGAELAIAEYNAANPGADVQLVPFDSQGSPDKAAALATSAVADAKIIGIVGPAFSGESEVANPIFDQAGLPIITQSATRPSLNSKGWKIFHRGVGNDLSQGPAIGRYLKDVAKATKVFIVDDQSAYGTGLRDEVKKILGAAVVGQDKVTEKQQEFGPVVTAVKSSGADAVFYGGYTPEAAPFLKQLRAGGFKGTFIGGDGLYDANMLSVTGKADVEGAVVTCPCGPATAAKGNFVADFKAKFGTDPGVYADVAYDLTKVFLEGFKAGKTTRADLQAFLGTYNGVGSATGVTYKWEANGELDPAQVAVWAFTAKDGAWANATQIPKG
ncbi:branched-chain amino acid ABC transporter substrate-binding protein [Catellatospora vulcania]|uniref:branched-chain amino acid ABC transporter substrate-binding protein n=1 Tax=Catellatospora vulcania TaxID=1460450 RepID=UPI0012D434FC|nr:branched-chain amino acid ABC transporter substrate-binding protein [Catellatospora vulcania]